MYASVRAVFNKFIATSFLSVILNSFHLFWKAIRSSKRAFSYDVSRFKKSVCLKNVVTVTVAHWLLLSSFLCISFSSCRLHFVVVHCLLARYCFVLSYKHARARHGSLLLRLRLRFIDRLWACFILLIGNLAFCFIFSVNPVGYRMIRLAENYGFENMF